MPKVSRKLWYGIYGFWIVES